MEQRGGAMAGPGLLNAENNTECAQCSEKLSPESKGLTSGSKCPQDSTARDGLTALLILPSPAQGSGMDFNDHLWKNKGKSGDRRYCQPTSWSLLREKRALGSVTPNRQGSVEKDGVLAIIP